MTRVRQRSPDHIKSLKEFLFFLSNVFFHFWPVLSNGTFSMFRKSWHVWTQDGLYCVQVFFSFTWVIHLFFFSSWFCVVIRAEEMPEVCTAVTSQHLKKNFAISTLNKRRKKKSIYHCGCLTVKEQLQTDESHQVALLINIGQSPPAESKYPSFVKAPM